MELTLRYYSDEAIEKVVRGIERISAAAAKMAGMPDDKLPKVFIYDVETPPVINDNQLTAKINKYASGIIGKDNINEVAPAMVGEDFGMYGKTDENIPICLIWLGSTNPDLMIELENKGEKPAPLHSPFLNPDYGKTIETGIKVMSANVIGLMNGNLE